jgi:hypothetical protein
MAMTKTIEDINLHTWFTNRKLDFAPNHFVASKTVLTSESKVWIQEKLSGRYAIVALETSFMENVPSFEDPKEAMMYELAWG